jgi:hypothetical protein
MATNKDIYIKSGNILRGDEATQAKLIAEAEKEAEEFSKALSKSQTSITEG